jgi:hypothetical protein
VKRYQTIAVVLVGLCASLLLAACAGPSTGSSGPGGSQATTQPTVAHPKPQSMPTIDMAFCQKILTIAEANSIMKPSTAANAIRIDHGPTGGSCNYEYAQFKAVVTITFMSFNGSDPQQTLDAAASQIASKTANIPNAKTTTTKVSGIGDAALFVATSASIEGIALHDVGLDVIDGKLFISCANFRAGSSPDSTQLSYLTQVAQLVVSRI